MQDSGHANAKAIKSLLKDVKNAVKDVVVIPIHGNPDQCADTVTAMQQIGVKTHTVGNHESISISDGKISNIEPKATPITWYAVRSISSNPLAERDIPLEGLKEFWEVTEDYQEIRKICEVENTQRFAPRGGNYTNAHKMLEKAENMPQKTTMKTKKRKEKSKKMSVPNVAKFKTGKSGR